MDGRFRINRRFMRIALACAGAILLCLTYGQQLLGVGSVLLTGLVLAFILEPLTAALMRLGAKPRALAVALSFLAVIAALAGVALLLLPPLIAQLRELSEVMAGSVNQLKAMLAGLNQFLAARQLPQIDIKQVDWGFLTSGLTGVLTGTTAFASGMIGKISQFGFSMMLAFYFLLYKEALLLSMELWIPMAARGTALRMFADVVRELRQYLKGQLTISMFVGVLTAIGLLLIGLPSAVLMGLIIGLFNLIPYFGPLIGAIPAVVMALSMGLTRALMVVVVVFIVQQLDGFWISPRVMGGMTGLSPPLVLVAITAGSGLFGISGMFFAIPVLLIVRICLRVWSMRDELVEKSPDM